MAALPAWGDLAAELENRLVTPQGQGLSQAESDLSDIEYFAFYYSAGWCPPCRAFTPDLVSFYRRNKRQSPNFELIFISSDRSEADMARYMRDYRMPWPALGYQFKGQVDALRQIEVSGIPSLVVLNADGEIVLNNRDGEKRIGARSVLENFTRLLREERREQSDQGGSDFDNFFGN